MRIYLTKYALTRGIIELEAVDVGDGMIRVDNKHGYAPTYHHGENRDWHRLAGAARLRAIDMKRAKLKQLRAQIERIQALEFD